VRAVFLSDPLRQLGGASLHGGVIDGGADRRRKTRRGELLRWLWLWTGPGAVHISPCSGDGSGIQGVRYPWLVATIGALLRLTEEVKEQASKPENRRKVKEFGQRFMKKR
jgi:hypothetical protein